VTSGDGSSLAILTLRMLVNVQSRH